ncbi:hypothetical protein DMN91_004592 [Ooceraea biroi]|uniref:Mitochondrial inner membrane protein COX18 n=1 Tax=Ooceraea biroi TaxID=2015173 RepID=A0A026WBP6_OOCBI|nr:cytochrome c oxidase assembly protein COX18, mitochondrial [Ooceraea biroi]EZA53388.1 Mitochondrial inner membrane protein COX18 [Ooceraea biroi]RLU22314.1 hypothetical protein DMN91_004592 [Ooceraea biroi]
MHVPKLQLVFLRQFKRVAKVQTINNINNNNAYFITSSSTLFHTIHSDYGAFSCTSNAQDLARSSQQPTLLKNLSAGRYSSGVRNNCFRMSHPGIISHAILYNRRKHVERKTGHSLCYNSIRHLSTGGTDSVVQAAAPVQYSGIFKMLSESTPVKVAQDSLLWIHDYTALPWWLVVILTTIMIRTTVTLPLSFYQQCIIAKLENLKPEMNNIVKELKIETRYGMQKYNWPKPVARRLYNHSVKKQWNELIIRENCHPAKATILVLVQLPLWISLSMSIRNLCYMLPKQDATAYGIHQEFTSDGFLWFMDLTVPDPFILPILMGLFNLAIIEINYMSRLQVQTKWKKYLTYFFRIVTIGLIPIAMYVPSCVSLYWTTSSAFGLLQNLLLLSPKLRRFARVPITASESQNPYMMLREKITARCRFRKNVEVSSKI